MLTLRPGALIVDGEQPEEVTDGKATITETTETPDSTSNVAQEERLAEHDVISVAAQPEESVPRLAATLLRRIMNDTEDSTERNDLSRNIVSWQSKHSDVPRAEPILPVSENVVRWAGSWAENWPALNDSTDSAASKNTETGFADRTTSKNPMMSGNSCSTPQNLGNGSARHSNYNSASNGESSIANSRESKNTSVNDIASDAEIERQASPANGNAPATTKSRKGKETEIAASSKQHQPGEMRDFIVKTASTPYIGSANAEYVATQYMNRKESLHIINNEALHTVGSVPLNSTALGIVPPGTNSGDQYAAVPYGHYPMNHPRLPNNDQTTNPVRDFLQEFNNQETFTNVPLSTMPPSITCNQSGQSDIENESMVERSDRDDLDLLPSEILDDMESTLEAMREKDRQRLLITERLLRQIRLLKQAQMAATIRRFESISPLSLGT
jgi:hypothetical protein